MPSQTPSSQPDPYDPVEPDRPFTNLELTMARFVNATADASGAFRGIVAAVVAARHREIANRIITRAKNQARFERARRWVRDHPDAS